MKLCYTTSMIHSWDPLQCDVDNFILKGFCVWDGWSIRAIVILNVQSYAGGKNLWGWPGFATLAKVVQCWTNQIVLFSVLCQIWMHFICDCHYILLYAFILVLVFLMSSTPWNLLYIRQDSPIICPLDLALDDEEKLLCGWWWVYPLHTLHVVLSVHFKFQFILWLRFFCALGW